jgi:hypothetical protein
MVNVLTSLKYPAHVVGLRADRPDIGLAVIDDYPTLLGTSRTHLNNLAAACAKSEVLAFSLLPTADLRQLHGRVFVVGGLGLQVSCDLCTVPLFSADPYFRRFVRFSSVGARALAPGGTAVREDAPEIPEPARLFVSPVRIPPRPGETLTPDQATLLAARILDEDYLRDGTEYFLLPPVSVPERLDAEPASYFAPERTRVREALAALPGLRPGPDQAAAVILWWLSNDPFLRDFLAEGTALLLAASPGTPSRVRLAVPAGVSALARYRAVTLFGDRWAGWPVWAAGISERLAQDAAELAATLRVRPTPPGPVEFVAVPAELPVSVEQLDVPTRGSSVPDLRAYVSTADSWEGSWNLLEALVERLPEGELRDLAFDAVVRPSGPRDMWAPDHALAEEAFEAHYWGYFGGGDVGPWRSALVKVVRAVAQSCGELPTDQRLGLSGDSIPRLTRDAAGRWRLTYPPETDEAELARWRLLLPLGTVFEPGGVVVLDDTTGGLDRRRWLG